MKYDIGATETQRKIFIQMLQKGFNLNQALLRASIRLYHYKTWYNNYLLKEYIERVRNNITLEEYAEMNTDGFIKDITYTPNASEIELFKKDKEFHDFVCDCHNLVSEVRRAPLVLEDYLLSKALSEGNKQWTASAWALERLFKNKYADKSTVEEIKPTKPISVEFVSNNKSEEQRVADMEALVDRELNGESKA